VAQNLFKQDRAGVSVLATLKVSKETKAEVLKRGWPLEVRVRFVSVRLKTGELEVLVTSLLDEEAYPTQEFAALYWRRWGQETFYGRIKGRMDLENCSGLTLEAVEQDFAATVLLSNVESVVIGPAESQLAQRTVHREQPVKINRAVSMHALKSRLVDLLASTLPAQDVLAELTRWFQDNPVSRRPNRKVPRTNFSAHRPIITSATLEKSCSDLCSPYFLISMAVLQTPSLPASLPPSRPRLSVPGTLTPAGTGPRAVRVAVRVAVKNREGQAPATPTRPKRTKTE